MHADEIARIHKRIVASRTKLLTAVDGLDEAAWEWRPEEGRWSVRLTLAHLGSAQWSHLEVVRRLLDGEPLDLPAFDLDDWNATQVARRADWSVVQILADLEAAQQATLDLLEGMDVQDLDTNGIHPALGEVSVGQVLRVVSVHDGMHRRDVVQLLREMGNC
jgi:uncharacterized damage-inducible protein DinB